MWILTLLGCLNLPTAHADPAPAGDETPDTEVEDTEAAPDPAPASHEHAVDLAGEMLQMQTHTGTLWYAGKAGNWALADYYLGKLDESVQTIERAPDFALGEELAAFQAAQKALRSVVSNEAAGDFGAAYGELTTACNGCHQASGHGFIEVQPPRINTWTNLDFSP